MATQAREGERGPYAEGAGGGDPRAAARAREVRATTTAVVVRLKR